LARQLRSNEAGCCPKGFGAQSASLPLGSVNKNCLVDVEGIFVNTTGVRHLTLKARHRRCVNKMRLGFLVVQVLRAANLVTPHKQFAYVPLMRMGLGLPRRREGFARLAQVYDLGGFPI